MSRPYERIEYAQSEASADSAPTVTISRRVRFSAAHRLWNPAWSEERNLEVFGAEANPLGHGHNYELEVTVSGPVDPETGMVINLREVDALLKERVLDDFAHRNINSEVPGFERLNPTVENLAVEVWSRLDAPLRERGVRLARIRLYETPDYWAEISAGNENEAAS